MKTKQKKSEIAFDALRDYNDSDSFVWTALTFNPEDKSGIEKFLKESKFMPDGARITAMRKIGGNVNGDAGRSDVLFVTTPTQFNPVARLRIGLTWTSDFVRNYAGDYGSYSPVALADDDE